MPHLGNKLASDMSAADRALLDMAPKSVLFAIAKHACAARDGDSYDASLASRSYLRLMIEEWDNLNKAGVVPQKVPAKARALLPE